jgi:lipopolysaccharide/colanic/teichoic acid biosynthesis glycosyltransferase
LYLILKRILDLLIASIALLLLSPLLIPVMLILLLTGEHEVFYFQRRIGKNGKPFLIWKFATMVKDSPNIGTGEITLRNDPRVTKVGRFLRKTKINELPQIFNVLKGDMSIVGPRPLMQVSYDLYTLEQQQQIYSVRPGITGIGSLIFRDEEKIVSQSSDPRETYRSIFPYKAALELWYKRHASVWLDFQLIFLTAWSIVFSNTRLPHKLFKDLPARPGFA